jgi:hypothetical protein
MAMTVEERIERAEHRVQEQMVRPIRLGTDAWVVASVSQPGAGYQVRRIDGVLKCECVAAQYENPCKHVAAVRLLESLAAA